MAEGLLLPLAKSVLEKLITSFVTDPTNTYLIQQIKAANSSKKDLQSIADKLEAICAVLEDAEKKQYANKAIKIWLRDLKSIVYDIDDLLDEVATDALHRKVNEGHLLYQLRYYLSSSNPLVSSFYLSHKIRVLCKKMGGIMAKKNEFDLTEHSVVMSRDEIRDPLDGCAYVYEPAIIGRKEAKKHIISKLLAVSDTINVSVLPIVGMGGIGKTALAKLVYHDVDNFDLKLWACVSDKFEVRKIIEDILKGATGDSVSNQNLGTLVKKLQDLLDGKKYFLVLDDVWIDDIALWTELKNMLAIGEAGSIMLITTRNATVASIVQTIEPYNLDRLPDHVCWSIFKPLAFEEGEEQRYPTLDEIGRSIVEKCGGIPLVVKCLGSLLRSERDEREWQRISRMDNFTMLHGQYDKVMQILKLSYDKLPSHLKPCFAYISLLIKDTDLHTWDLPFFWSAHGLLRLRDGDDEIEGSGYTYFMELVSRSVLQEPSSQLEGVLCKCKMHDLLHDLAVSIMGEELAIVSSGKVKVSQFTRHIVWDYESPNSLLCKQFPRELLKCRNVRTFRFGHEMNHISRPFVQGIIYHLNRVRVLDLRGSWFQHLPKSIGNLKHLRYFDISGNCIIKSIPNTICKLLNLETCYLDNCEQLKELPRDVYRLVSLRKLMVTTGQTSLVSTKFKELSCLVYLWFGSCKQLISLWDNNDIGCLTSLKSFGIEDCPKLTCLPNSMKFLVGLKTLVIWNCEELDLEKGEGLQGLQSLRTLGISGVPKMACLPHGIRSAAVSLRCLLINDCEGLIRLPDWLQYFASLQRIDICQCPNLLALPEGFCNLKSLQELYIEGCPHLSKRCVVPTGEDYPLIQHVCRVIVDGVHSKSKSKNRALA